MCSSAALRSDPAALRRFIQAAADGVSVPDLCSRFALEYRACIRLLGELGLGRRPRRGVEPAESAEPEVQQ